MSTFDEHAHKYDGWFVNNHNVLESEVLLVKQLVDPPGEALSVGCGSGLFEARLREDHGVVIGRGVEPSEGMARIARDRGLDVTIAPAEALPFDEGQFDTVLMNGITAYVDTLSRAVAQARRVLRPGGRIVMCDVPATSGYGLLYRLAAEVGGWDDPHLRRVAPAVPYPVAFVAQARWRTTGELMDLLREQGFQGFELAQTLTVHPRFSNDAVEPPVAGHRRGGYVGIRARRA